jgi:hypothetical protein
MLCEVKQRRDKVGNKKWSQKPKRQMANWFDFILEDGAIPAVVEAVNNSGGLYRRGRFLSWDFDGNYYAIWNQCGNSVWCHGDNLKLLSKGSVKTLSKRKDVESVIDYRGLMNSETPRCGLKPTHRTGIGDLK